MANRKPESGRGLEDILYGTPQLPGVRTPDGRTVTELHRGRMDDRRHHGETTALQRQTVQALQDLHGGRTVVSREDYLAKEHQTQEILRGTAQGLWGIRQNQEDLLRENQALTAITGRGFSELGQGIDQVREGVAQMAESIEVGIQTLHGPGYPEDSVKDMMIRRQNFFEVLGAYQNGLLTPKARRDFEEVVNERLAPTQACDEIENLLAREVSDPNIKNEIRALLRVLDRPMDLVGNNSGQAFVDLAKLEAIAEFLKSETLFACIQRVRGFIDLAGDAKVSPPSEELMVDLANNGLTTPEIQHQIKRYHREARVGGSQVDMNYNLLEVLEQGDYAGRQRETGIAQRGRLVQLAEAGMRFQEERLEQGDQQITLEGLQLDVMGRHSQQHDLLIGQGKTAIEQRDTTNLRLDEGNRQRGRLVELGAAQVGLGIQQIRQRAEANNHLARLEEMGEVRARQGEALVRIGADQLEVGRQGLRHLVEGNQHLARLEALGEMGNRSLVRVAEGVGELVEEGRISNRHLELITDSLVDANDHLVNLEELGGQFIEVVQYGLGEVTETLRRGFIMQLDALGEIAGEIALSRVMMLEGLRDVERTVVKVGNALLGGISYNGQLLEKLVDLEVNSFGNRARQRAQQGVVALRRAETPEEFKEARKIFERGIDEDWTFMTGQYGLAVAAEGMEDRPEAKRRYQIVGKNAPEEQRALAADAWKNLARIKQSEGDLPNAIKALRRAIERDSASGNQWLLVRALAMAGLATEAAQLMVEVIKLRPAYVLDLGLDSAFEAMPLGSIYFKLWEERIIREGSLVSYLLNELIKLGDEEGALGIFERLLRNRPESILKNRILDLPFFPQIRGKVREIIENLIKEKPETFAAKTWYIIAFIALRENLSDAGVATLFKLGLSKDFDFFKRNKMGIRATLNSIDPMNRQELVERVCNMDPTLQWLKSNK